MRGKLYRSQTDRMLGGVAGGLGQYLDIDPTLVRVFFALLGLVNGIGVVTYLVLWVVVPPEGAGEVAVNDTIRTGANEISERARAFQEELRGHNHRSGTLIGAVLIAVGVLFLLQNLNFLWLRWLNFDLLWPLLLIAGGIALLWRRAEER